MPIALYFPFRFLSDLQRLCFPTSNPSQHGQPGGTKLENSALRSTAGSETHWLILHFDSHVIRLYHDIVGVILLLDGDANLPQKVPRKDVEERNIEKYTATLDGKR